MKPRRRGRKRRSTRSLDAVHEQLLKWKEQQKTLLVEIGIGVVAQAGFGRIRELPFGKFAVHLIGSRSLILLNDQWARYVRLDKSDDKPGAFLVAQKGMNSPWIRLSAVDVGEHDAELRTVPSEADIRTAVAQLKLWAQARTRILYGSGSKANDVVFVGQLVGPHDDDSFLVVSTVLDPESGLPTIGGRISPRCAEDLRVHQEENHVEVVLRSEEGNTCTVFYASGSPADQFLRLRSLSKMAQ